MFHGAGGQKYICHSWLVAYNSTSEIFINISYKNIHSELTSYSTRLPTLPSPSLFPKAVRSHAAPHRLRPAGDHPQAPRRRLRRDRLDHVVRPRRVRLPTLARRGRGKWNGEGKLYSCSPFIRRFGHAYMKRDAAEQGWDLTRIMLNRRLRFLMGQTRGYHGLNGFEHRERLTMWP